MELIRNSKVRSHALFKRMNRDKQLTMRSARYIGQEGSQAHQEARKLRPDFLCMGGGDGRDQRIGCIAVENEREEAGARTQTGGTTARRCDGGRLGRTGRRGCGRGWTGETRFAHVIRTSY